MNHHYQLTKGLLCLLFLLLPFFGKSQTYTWTGLQDTVFFKSENWQNSPSISDLKLAWQNYIIPSGTPNPPSYTENVFGKSGTVQIENITIDNGATFKIYTYTIYTNYASANGNLTLNNGSLNIRKATTTPLFNTGTSTLSMNKSVLNTKYAMEIGSGTGNVTANLIGSTINAENNSALSIAYTGTSTATINVKQASIISTGGTLRIGANGTVNVAETGSISAGNLTLTGKITLAGLGNITLSGNQKTAVETLVDAGKITSSEGKSISVIYNSETNKTIVTSGSTMQWISKQGVFIVLTNGIVTAKIEETSSKLKSFVVNGIELLAQTNTANPSRVGQYHDFTFGADESGGFEVISGTTFSIKESNDDYIDISFKKTYSNSGVPLDVDIHYVLKKGESGIYTYNILYHKPTYPAVNIGSWRQVFWTANNGSKYTTEKIFVTERKKWEMPSLTDTWEPTGIAEIVKVTSGAKAGKYDGKYEYSENLVDIPAYGFASDINKVGLWAITPNYESFNGGPTHQDLNAASGIIHICMNGIHYGESGYNVAEGEDWSKIYGPYMLYASTKETAEANWTDAKAKAAYEKQQWPYTWLTNTPSYPLSSERGNLTGTFKISDSYKPEATGKNAWIGLTQLSVDNDRGWEMESKNYQYWVKTDENGNFNISARPGTYTLYAFAEGVIEEYKRQNVTVTAGNTNNLGNVEWNLNRTKKLLWEIGVANRSTSEFKMGDLEYSTGFTHEKFRNYFSQTIEYKIAEKNWSEKIPYVHARYPTDNTYTTFEPWTWHMNFDLPSTFNPNSGGSIDLNVAFSSNAKAQYWIYVNNRDKTSISFSGYPEAIESNTYIRQANHGKYSYKTFTIARNRLKAGANTITFVMPSSNGNVSHVMYDYISLAGDETMVLPISLTSFKLEKTSDKINLKWATSSEENANKFIIEKAGKDGNFIPIGETKANNRPSNYSFTDHAPFIGENYYRLNQLDLNGENKIYGPVSAFFSLKNDDLFSVSPNPVTDYLNVKINSKISGTKNLVLTDIEGNILLEQNTNANLITISIEKKLAPGVYLLKLNSENYNGIQKISIK